MKKLPLFPNTFGSGNLLCRIAITALLTSFKVGWQTDRGMIFIIYGIPNYVYKSGVEEKWIYNSIGVGTAIVFNFNYYDLSKINNDTKTAT